MMKTHPPLGTVQQAGATWGRAWRGWLRLEKRLSAWGVTQGVPAALTQILLWGVKLLLVGGLFYLAFWVVLLVLFAFVAVLAAKNQDENAEENEPEWRNGLGGYGLYRDGTRVDLGDTDDE